jgi:hypothetical protein
MTLPQEKPPETEMSPGKTVLIQIAGTVIVAVATFVFLYSLALALAFGGQAPLTSFLFTPFVPIVLLVAAGGGWLILYARKRNRLYREAVSRRRRNA